MSELREDRRFAGAREVTGLILAGGRGSRMGGRDKGLVTFSGRPMLQHVLDALRPQVGEILISANRNLAWYRRTGCRVLTDRQEDFAGPLAGILAGLRAARTPWLLVVPCDGPLLPADLTYRLQDALAGREEPVAVAHDGERLHPTFALMRVSLAAALEAYLARGERKVAGFYNESGYAAVDFSDCPDAFLNINTPADMVRLEARAGPG